MFNKLRERFMKKKQSTCCYCPKCRNELTSSNSFVYDNDGLVKYVCDNCGNITFWDFKYYPIPVLRRGAVNNGQQSYCKTRR